MWLHACISHRYRECTAKRTSFLKTWYPLLIIAAAYLLGLAFNGSDNQLLRLNTTGLIQYHGYEAEEHELVTKDGYILSIHRISRGRPKPAQEEDERDQRGRKYGPVLLLHGFICSSSMWVFQGPGADLAFILADEGFDVWIANFRGSSYTRVIENSTLDPADFSFQEMGQLDLPAMVDYVRNTTGYDKVGLVGHSMGTTSTFVGLSSVPGLNQKISHVALLAPFIRTVKLHDFMHKVLEGIYLALGNVGHDFLDRLAVGQRNKIHAISSWIIANIPVPMKFIYKMVGYHIYGANSKCQIEIAEELISAHIPDSVTHHTMAHFYDLMEYSEFRMRDFGDRNKEKYNSTRPPVYNTSSITVPISAFMGTEDTVAPYKDFLQKMKTFGAPKSAYKLEGFNHMDVVWSKEAVETVFPTIVSHLKKASSTSHPPHYK